MNRMQLTFSLLMQRIRLPGGATRRRFLMMNLADLDPLPLGPGWFDSSWELEHGLEVNHSVEVDAQLQTWFDATTREPALACECAVAVRAAIEKAGAKADPDRCCGEPNRLHLESATLAGHAPGRSKAGGTDNLIEFEFEEIASWELPQCLRRTPRHDFAELELDAGVSR